MSDCSRRSSAKFHVDETVRFLAIANFLEREGSPPSQTQQSEQNRNRNRNRNRTHPVKRELITLVKCLHTDDVVGTGVNQQWSGTG